MTGKGMLCTRPLSKFDMMVTYLPSLKLQLVVAIVNILLRMAVYINLKCFGKFRVAKYLNCCIRLINIARYNSRDILPVTLRRKAQLCRFKLNPRKPNCVILFLTMDYCPQHSMFPERILHDIYLTKKPYRIKSLIDRIKAFGRLCLNLPSYRPSLQLMRLLAKFTYRHYYHNYICRRNQIQIHVPFHLHIHFRCSCRHHLVDTS